MGSLTEARRRILLSSPHKETIQNADIASFSTDIRSPLRALRVGIDPVQDLHGYDAPWPAGGGKNKLVPSVNGGSITWNDVTISAQNGELYLSGKATTSGGRTTLRTVNFSLPAGSYVISCPTTQFVLHDTSSNILANTLGTPTFTLTEETTVYAGFNVVADTTYSGVLKAQIESGTTATAYAPYSNICPISGWSAANLWRTGKNLLDVSDYQIETSSAYNKSAGTTLTFGGTGASVSGTNPIEIAVTTGWRGATFFSKPLKVGATYYLRYRITAPSPGYIKRTIYWVDDDNKIVVNLGYSSSVDQSAEYVYHNTLTPPQDGLRLAFVVESQTSQTITIYDMGVIVGDWETYAPYTGTTATIQLGQTVYGGTLDVVNGVLTVDRAMYTFTGNESWTLQGGIYGGIKYYSTQYLLRNVAKLPDGNSNSVPIITSIGSFNYSYNTLQAHPNTICIAADGRIGIEGGLYNSSGDTLKGIQLVYELATPITIPLSDIAITTLVGQNVVWGDSGKIEFLKYWTH